MSEIRATTKMCRGGTGKLVIWVDDCVVAMLDKGIHTDYAFPCEERINDYASVLSQRDEAVKLLKEIDEWSDDKYDGTVGREKTYQAVRAYLATVDKESKDATQGN